MHCTPSTKASPAPHKAHPVPANCAGTALLAATLSDATGVPCGSWPRRGGQSQPPTTWEGAMVGLHVSGSCNGEQGHQVSLQPGSDTEMSKVTADVRWLTFRLKNGQSIGPDRLKDGWVIASETARCGVRREHIEGSGLVYALYA